ncbi:MAG: class I SAM-dependent methyltransferase [Myxococcota bacterium]
MRAGLFDEMAAVEAEHWWFQGRRRILMDVLRRQVGTAERILDVGAGTGLMARAMAELGPVDALEMAPEALAHLEQTGATVRHGGLPAPELPDAHYDLITAFDVLEHIEDDRMATAEVSRLLAPGGSFVATVPAHPVLFSAHDRAHHHHRRYTRTRLVDVLTGAGLQIAFLSPYLTVLLPFFLADRLLQRIRPSDGAVGRLPRPLNTLLEALFAVERRWLAEGWANPVGASFLVRAVRP